MLYAPVAGQTIVLYRGTEVYSSAALYDGLYQNAPRIGRQEFYVTDAMTTREWMGTNYELRHVVTRFVVNGFHHRLYKVKNYHAFANYVESSEEDAACQSIENV